MDFSNLLASWIDHKGITQKELAEKMGVTKSCVSQYVRGRRKKLGPEIRKKFAKGFDLSIDNFMKGPYKKNPDVRRSLGPDRQFHQGCTSNIYIIVWLVK